MWAVSKGFIIILKDIKMQEGIELKRKASLAIVLIFFLFTSVTSLLAENNVESTTIHQKAVQYLINNFNPSIDLISETNSSNTYWLVSDNLLAYYALRNDDPTISNEIATALKNHVITYDLPHDSNGLPISFKHEAVIGDILSEVNNHITFDNPILYPLINLPEGWNIVTEIDNNISDPVNENVSHFADLFAYRGLSFCKSNNLSEAKLQYNEMINQFWKGQGFVDDAFNTTTKEYSTYKLGLALILANKLNISDSNTIEMLNLIEHCEDVHSGGIHTEYEVTEGLICYSGETNTETTSIIAIATENVPPDVSGTNYLKYAVFAAIAVSVIIVLVALLIKHKRPN
jgi:hypothetical protein